MQYRHILFATDIDDGSLHNVRKALDLSRALSDKFSLLHVAPDSISDLAMGSAKLYEEILDTSKAEIMKIAKALGIPKSDQYVIEGSPKEVILMFAEKANIDLIILNSHRHNWLEMLGATTNYVVNKAQCDVLIIDNDKNQK
ncbi:universal stress protein [Piscirickettsia litoralis]|uniref:Universal stress protein n=1 Tax=Piscirickettsia litoralis TaxID=1891921 RepID=A0ABX3ABZ2_9GAMM|nr:universal stress protein [Piscirickettsia litoralis]ODN43649.1 hypothetical protein BGC07_12960 [Piscirickettsia litoralis]